MKMLLRNFTACSQIFRNTLPNKERADTIHMLTEVYGLLDTSEHVSNPLFLCLELENLEGGIKTMDNIS